jgi:two-component system, NtrC family, nitrogen regulation response regulator NtrX
MNKKAKILVVDDEDNIRESLKEILTDEGYDIFLAQDAKIARKIKDNEKLDLILLDIWMPDCDGISLLKEWEKNKQLTCPVIMMSGHGTIDTAIEATKIGAFDFLEKPISLQKLLKTISDSLKKVVDIKRLSPEFIEKSQQPIVQIFKKTINLLKKDDLFFIYGLNNNFLKIVISYLYGNDFYLVDAKKEINESLLKLVLEKGKNHLIIINNETIRGKTFHDLKTVFKQFNEKGVKIVVSDSEESFIRDTFFSDMETVSNLINLPVGKDVDSIPDYAIALLDYYISTNPNIGYKEFDISALNFLRSSNKFLDFDTLEEFIYRVVISIDKEQISREDIEIADEKSEKVLSNQADRFNYDRSLKEARDSFEKSYFEYHLSKNKNISDLSKIADIERTHLYRKLKQLGIKTK